MFMFLSENCLNPPWTAWIYCLWVFRRIWCLTKHGRWRLYIQVYTLDRDCRIYFSKMYHISSPPLPPTPKICLELAEYNLAKLLFLSKLWKWKRGYSKQILNKAVCQDIYHICICIYISLNIFIIHTITYILNIWYSNLLLVSNSNFQFAYL